MRRVCLVFFTDESFDCLTTFEQAFKEIGLDTESVRLPNVWIYGLTRPYLHHLKMLIREKKSDNRLVLFSPQSTELFLDEADLTLIYSAYRSWFNAKKIRVIPHLWTPIGAPASIDQPKWTTKPPLRIGFMGRSYTASRLASAVSKLPTPTKKKLLEGKHLRHPACVALMNELGVPIASINMFARIETIQILKAKKDKYRSVEVDFVEKHQFDGSEGEITEYIHHLETCTYVVCPRGTENYSFRIYEALSRGRIPVIIDTDVVLPKEIDWDSLSVRVPYDSLDGIYDIILDDYESRSGREFISRQEEAFLSMSTLRKMGWVRDLASEIRASFRDC